MVVRPTRSPMVARSPVSSKSSRRAPAASLSPARSFPPGSDHLPAPGSSARRTSSSRVFLMTMTLAQGTSWRCSLMMLVYHRRASPRCHYQEFGPVAERFIERLLSTIACRCDRGQGAPPPLLTALRRLGDECSSDALSPFADRDVDRKQPRWVEREQCEAREPVRAFGHQRGGTGPREKGSQQAI